MKSMCGLVRAQASELAGVLDSMQLMYGVLIETMNTVDDLAERQMILLESHTHRHLSSLVVSVGGLECRTVSGGDPAEVQRILPDADQFALCQTEAAWRSAERSFAGLLPAGAAWVPRDPDPNAACTPLPTRDGPLGAAVLCSPSLPHTLGHLADVRAAIRSAPSGTGGGDPAAGDVGATCESNLDCLPGNTCHTTRKVCLQDKTGVACYGEDRLCARGVYCEEGSGGLTCQLWEG
jgi:hypothetical protein